MHSKRAAFIPLFAGSLILLHTILINAVTPPVHLAFGLRYLFYWLLTIFSGLGTNLLALYLGYTAGLTKKPWQQLTKISFYFIIISLLSVLGGILWFKTFAARDLWLILFPISYDLFPFAASILFWYITGPFLVRYIAQSTIKMRRALAFLLIWFIFILPFIFSKPLWGITNASNFIWVGTLFILGILFAQGELRWLSQYRKSVSILLTGIVLIMINLKLTPITQTAVELQGRFYSSHMLNGGLISLAVFGLLITTSRVHWSKLQNLNWPSWFALSAYLVSCLPIVKYHLNTELRIKAGLPGFEWMTWLFSYVVLLIFVVTLLTFLVAWLSHLSICRKIIVRFTVNEFTDFIQAPQFASRLIHENWRLLLVIISGFVFTIIQLVITNLTVRSLSWALITEIFTNSTNQIILNVIIFISAFLFLFSLINRFWPALVLTGGTSIFISITVFLKLDLRDEPLLPADLAMITALNEIIKMVSPLVIIAIIGLLIVLVAISLMLQRRLGGIYASRIWKKRFFTIIAMTTFFAGSFWVNHGNTLPHIVFKAFSVNSLFYDQADGARLNGPIVQFINNLDVKIMTQPAGYSKAKIKKIMARYDQVAKKINQTRINTLSDRTVIFVLSESFSDPNRVPQMQVSPNPIPFVTNLKQTTDSGLMLSSGYGGGTANMEWQALTGLSISNLSPTLPTPYTQLVSKQKITPAFTDLFDSKIAIHPFNASLYNRKTVFEKFGFQKFYYEGSSDQLDYQQKIDSNPYISDDAAYQQTLKVMNQAQTGSRFIQLSTMQNHMPYNAFYNDHQFKVTGSAFNAENRASMQTYVQGLAYTDRALKEFITAVDKINRPVTVVWYGDHLAALYKPSLMAKYPIQLHQTDYFIYNNQDHKITYTDRLVSNVIKLVT